MNKEQIPSVGSGDGFGVLMARDRESGAAGVLNHLATGADLQCELSQGSDAWLVPHTETSHFKRLRKQGGAFLWMQNVRRMSSPNDAGQPRRHDNGQP